MTEENESNIVKEEVLPPLETEQPKVETQKTTEPNWDDAVKSSGFVKLEEDKEKILILTNHKLIKRDKNAKFQPNEIEFIADVLEEDGNKVEQKIFNTTSKRLKIKLKPIFENKKSTDVVVISILQVGQSFDCQYSVRELTQK